MEVVLDVNVFVSAALSGAGPSAQLVAAVRDGRLVAVVSPKLLIELAGVLRRDRFRRYLSLDEVEEYVREVERLCRIAADPEVVPAVLRDPDDDYLVALGHASSAASLVSGDLDLRDAVGIGIEVLTPRQLLDRLG